MEWLANVLGRFGIMFFWRSVSACLIQSAFTCFDRLTFFASCSVFCGLFLPLLCFYAFFEARAGTSGVVIACKSIYNVIQ